MKQHGEEEQEMESRRIVRLRGRDAGEERDEVVLIEGGDFLAV